MKNKSIISESEVTISSRLDTVLRIVVTELREKGFDTETIKKFILDKIDKI